jgi:checkpoint serine/threonine-protein kinase
VIKKLTFPYWFVIYLTLEMLNILNYLHKCKILHADIRVDNFLVDQLPNSIDYFEAYRTKCLLLIDFNRSIDLTMLPTEAEFDAKTENKSLLCCEMKSNKTWTYHFYSIIFMNKNMLFILFFILFYFNR